jgi:hypothetical protein
VVLLWALARARARARRLTFFDDVQEELAELLAPFAIATKAPDPVMPWAALRNSGWWQVGRTNVPGPVTDNVVKKQNPLGGLSQTVYWRALKDVHFSVPRSI